MGLGKLWEALIPAIARGVGSIGGPLLLPYDAKMKMLALDTLSRHLAERDIALVSATATFDERAVVVASFEQRREQANREAIALQAIRDAETLIEDGRIDPDFEGVSAEPDWLNKFWRYAADVSDKDFQVLWGKILARQVAGFANLSARSLQMVSNLSKVEAEAIELGARRVISFAHDTVGQSILCTHAIFRFSRERGFHFDVEKMERCQDVLGQVDEVATPLLESGFLAPVGLSPYEIALEPSVSDVALGSRLFKATFEEGHDSSYAKSVTLRGLPISHSASALCNLLQPLPDDDFVEAITYVLGHQGITLTPIDTRSQPSR